MTSGNDAFVTNLIAGRIKSLGFLVLLAVGIFGILTLIKDYPILSLKWNVLTGLYFANLFAIRLAFIAWAWHSIFFEGLSQESARYEIDRIIDQVRNNQ